MISADSWARRARSGAGGALAPGVAACAMLALVRFAVVVAAAASVAGCDDAIVLRIASDRPVPQAIDAICVGIADTASSGGQFGRVYHLEGELAGLPQTLRVEPGDADTALAWVRADRGGVPTLSTSAVVDFTADVTLALPRCQVGPAAAPRDRGLAGPPHARLAASRGQGGTLIVALGTGGSAGIAQILDSRLGELVATDAPAPPPGTPVDLLAIDVDGDCDDDIVIATDAAPPTLWRRDGAELVPAGEIGTATMSALAAADIEHDGDFDLILGGGSSLEAWFNDGAGTFTHVASALAGEGGVSMISALATGDLDGDGHADLVVGQAGPPLAAWLGKGGRFDRSDGVVPAIPLDVVRLTLADVDGDYDPDLGIAVRDAPMRLLVDRDGRLEDRSFVRLPQPVPTVHAVAFGGWDAGCEPDALLAAEPGAAMLRGLAGGAFEVELVAPPATDVVLADIDDDGDLDALYATPEGVRWLAR